MRNRRIILTLVLALLPLFFFQNCGTHVEDFKDDPAVKDKSYYVNKFLDNKPGLSMLNEDGNITISVYDISVGDDFADMSFSWMVSDYADGPYSVLSYGSPTLDLSLLGNNFEGYIMQVITILTEDLSYSFETIPLNVNIAPRENPDPATDVTDGLIEQVSFDESSGTTATNSVTSNDGTLIGGPAFVAGLVNNALSFSGSNQFVNFGALNYPLDAISLSTYIYIDEYTGNSMHLFHKGPGDSGNEQHLTLAVNKPSGSNYMRFTFRLKTTSGNITYCNPSGAGIREGEWMHVAAVYDGTYMYVYSNGNEIGRCEKSGTIAASSTADFIIGNGYNLNNPFHGAIDEFRIYNRALTNSEVKTLAEAIE